MTVSGVLEENQGGWCGWSRVREVGDSKGYKEPRGYGEESEMQRETERRRRRGREETSARGGRTETQEDQRLHGHFVTNKASSSPTNPMPDLSLMPQLPRLEVGRGDCTVLSSASF